MTEGTLWFGRLVILTRPLPQKIAKFNCTSGKWVNVCVCVCGCVCVWIPEDICVTI